MWLSFFVFYVAVAAACAAAAAACVAVVAAAAAAMRTRHGVIAAGPAFVAVAFDSGLVADAFACVERFERFVDNVERILGIHS